MAKKLPDLQQAGLGDITKLMHNQGVSDLSWLAVDEKDYRAAEALPKQNLDIIPEFQKALIEEDDVPHVIPLKPHTIVNRNPLENSGQTSAVNMTAPIRNRVAKMVMMGMGIPQITERIQLEFAPGDIRRASKEIREVLYERGVLGNVYVDAKHFPRICHDPKERKFARTAGKNAMYVIGGCDNSNGCQCKKTGMCMTFGGKKVVAEVPYDAKTFAHYAVQLASEKRHVSSVPIGNPAEIKEILRSSFLKRPLASKPDGVRTIQTQHKVASQPVTQKDIDQFWQRRFTAPTADQMPSAAYLKYAKKMMHGANDTAILAASGDPSLIALSKEFGILGHSYLDMDALGGCKPTLEFIRSREASYEGKSLYLDFVLRRAASCPNCKGAADGACSQICHVTQVVSSKPELGNQAFTMALQRAVIQGRLSSEQAKAAHSKMATVKAWPTYIAHINLYQPRIAQQEEAREYSGINMTGYRGEHGTELHQAQMNPEEVRRNISHLMNTGLSGKPLQAAILLRYERGDLAQVVEVGRRAALDEGVQGTFFIDPTAYKDYGKTCDQGSKMFRKRGAPHVLASSGCTGCQLQTAPGWCSKYAKTLIRQVPTNIRQAAVAARRQLPVVQVTPVENPIEKYELGNELAIDINGSKSRPLEVTISGPSLDE